MLECSTNLHVKWPSHKPEHDRLLAMVNSVPRFNNQRIADFLRIGAICTAWVSSILRCFHPKVDLTALFQLITIVVGFRTRSFWKTGGTFILGTLIVRLSVSFILGPLFAGAGSAESAEGFVHLDEWHKKHRLALGEAAASAIKLFDLPEQRFELIMELWVKPSGKQTKEGFYDVVSGKVTTYTWLKRECVYKNDARKVQLQQLEDSLKARHPSST